MIKYSEELKKEIVRKHVQDERSLKSLSLEYHNMVKFLSRCNKSEVVHWFYISFSYKWWYTIQLLNNRFTWPQHYSKRMWQRNHFTACNKNRKKGTEVTAQNQRQSDFSQWPGSTIYVKRAYRFLWICSYN